jgi:thiol-disulfide isomerase/thioredoxin
MRTTSTLTATLAAAATALLLAACGSTDGGTTATAGAGATSSSSATATSGAAATASPTGSTATGGDVMAAGAYLTKEQYQSQMASREGTKVVYFFHAPWCPDCRATEKAIARDGVPAGLTVVKVDFDSETDLRREFGVTQQHTFVQVAPDGAELAKWTGSENGADIKAKTV